MIEQTRVEAIFSLAREIPDRHDRDAYVNNACGHDPQLLQQLQELLQSHEQSNGPLDAPPPGLSFTRTESSVSKTSGTKIDHYQIDERIGEGGFGIVYRVRDTDLNRTLAMKVVKTPDGRGIVQQALGRFLEEAQVTAQLDHPGIVPVHALGRNETGEVFFTMKLVKGYDLQEILRFVEEENDGWNFSRIVGVMTKVCQAVAFAHGKGVMHRDLKPSNIMVGRFGEVYVMDWGLAKVVGKPDCHDLRIAEQSTQPTYSTIQSMQRDGSEQIADSPLITMDGSVIGTPAYMSVEQAQGRVDDVDFSSDTYSLGAILYFLLAGHPPYCESGLRISPHTLLARVIDGPPKAIHALNPQASTELVAICNKAMQRTKTDRYASCLELADDLQAYLDRRVVKAYRTGPVAEFKSWVGRNRLTATVAACALMALLGISGFWTYHEHANTLRMQHRLAEQFLLRGQSFCEAGQIDRGLHWFVRAIRECPEASPDLNSDIRANLISWSGHCNHLLHVFDHEEAIAESGDATRRFSMVFSPDGSRIITGGVYDQKVRVWSLESGKQVVTPMDHGESISSVYVSFDGANIISVGSTTAVIWTSDGEPIGKPIRSDASLVASAFDAAHSTLALGSVEGTATIWSTESGEQIGPPKQRASAITAMAVSPNGSLILAGYEDGTAQFWPVDTDERLGESMEYAVAVSTVAFSPDGSRVVVGYKDGQARLWSTSTQKVFGSPLQHDDAIVVVAFSPDGKLLATASADSTSRLWSADDGSPSSLPLKHHISLRTLAFSPNGRHLLTGSSDFTAKLWSIRTGQMIGIEITNKGPVSDAIFSPDGKSIAMASKGRVELWTMVDAAEPQIAYAADQDIWAISFSPDGNQILTGGITTPLVIWERGKLDVVTRFPAESRVWEAKFSPNGQYVLAGETSESSQAVLWTIDGKTVTRYDHDSDVRCVAFESSGRIVATGSFDFTAKIWVAKTGELLATLTHPGIVEDLCFTPDGGNLITACDDGKVRFWSIATANQTRAPIEHAGSVLAVEISPDGKLIATGSRDHTARLWDFVTSKPVGPILEHRNWVEDVVFSLDGKSLFTAGSERRVQLWTVSTGRRIGPSFICDHPIHTLAMDPRGECILSSELGSGAKLWTIPKLSSFEISDFETWVQEIAGSRMDDDGTLHRLGYEPYRAEL